MHYDKIPADFIIILAAHPYYRLAPHADIDFGAKKAQALRSDNSS